MSNSKSLNGAIINNSTLHIFCVAKSQSASGDLSMWCFTKQHVNFYGLDK